MPIVDGRDAEVIQHGRGGFTRVRFKNTGETKWVARWGDSYKAPGRKRGGKGFNPGISPKTPRIS